MKDMGKIQGFIAEFSDPHTLLEGTAKMRDEGYRNFDCHSPFPIHGLDEAMGEKRSPLGFIVAVAAFIGVMGAIAIQGWMSAVDYKLVIAGKPFFSYQAFFPVTFSIAVLLSAVTALIGMLSLIRPRFNHPVFHSERFSQRATDDGFFISVLTADPYFDEVKTRDFLVSIGGKNVEALREG
jgi:hypothetical protein